MPFGSLWLPVIVSAVAVFVASSIIHMALRYHRADCKALPNEDAVREALGKGSPAPGLYFVPHVVDSKEFKKPAVVEKFVKGPVAIITVARNGPPAMGKYLGLWFGLCLFVAFVSAYLARHTLTFGADGLTVMRVTGTMAFMGYGVSHISDSIWKQQPWGNTARALLDAAIYAVITGLIFRLLWPSA